MNGLAQRLGLESPEGAFVAELETNGPDGPRVVRAWIDGDTLRWRGATGQPDGIPLRALRRVLVAAEEAGTTALTLLARYAPGASAPARRVVLRDVHRRPPGEAAAFVRVLREIAEARHPRIGFEGGDVRPLAYV